MNVFRLPLFWILLFGFLIRLAGIEFGLPDVYHADEPMMVNHAVSYASWDFNPHYFKLPPLLSYLLFIIYGIYFAIGCLFGFFGSISEFQELFIANPTSFYLLSRFIFGVLFGTASIYLVYSLSVSFFKEKGIALLSSFFLAFSFLHVIHSHYVYHDIPMVFFILLTVRKIYELYKDPKLSHYLWSAFFGGIAAGFKYNAALLSLSLFLAHVLKEEKISFRALFLDKKLYAAAVVMIFTYFLTNPFSIVSFSEFAGELTTQFDAEDRLPFFYHLRYSLAEGMGKPLLVCSLAGFLIVIFQLGRAGSVLFSFPLIFYLFCVFVSQPHERYMLPIVPFFAISAAYFIFWLYLLSTKPRVAECEGSPLKKSSLLYLMAGLVALPTLIKSLYVDGMLFQSDTRTEAKEWIEKNIPKEASIALDHTFFLPRLLHSSKQLEEKWAEADSALQKRRIELISRLSERKTAYHLFYLVSQGDMNEAFLFSRPVIKKSWKELKERGIQYVVIHKREEDFSDFYLNIDQQARLLQTFSPYRDSKKIYSVEPVINTAVPFLSQEVYSRVRTGYTIQVYAVEI
ncbi:MAG: glycosyltransferase family 39 protein [Deltaproteobacteria bacterium]